MITPDNYMGWTNIFINEIIGSPLLFILLGLIIIVYISVINSFSTLNTVAFSVVFVMITLTMYYDSLILGLILLIIGILAYTGYNRFLSKQ
ncbi:MAG TPA: hypothetical protein PLT65_04345 [Bacilli bacterium]|nr:hypothetical protein [Bacilli bacterium]